MTNDSNKSNKTNTDNQFAQDISHGSDIIADFIARRLLPQAMIVEVSSSVLVSLMEATSDGSSSPEYFADLLKEDPKAIAKVREAISCCIQEYSILSDAAWATLGVFSPKLKLKVENIAISMIELHLRSTLNSQKVTTN